MYAKLLAAEFNTARTNGKEMIKKTLFFCKLAVVCRLGAGDFFLHFFWFSSFYFCSILFNLCATEDAVGKLFHFVLKHTVRSQMSNICLFIFLISVSKNYWNPIKTKPKAWQGIDRHRKCIFIHPTEQHVCRANTINSSTRTASLFHIRAKTHRLIQQDLSPRPEFIQPRQKKKMKIENSTLENFITEIFPSSECIECVRHAAEVEFVGIYSRNSVNISVCFSFVGFVVGDDIGVRFCRRMCK